MDGQEVQSPQDVSNRLKNVGLNAGYGSDMSRFFLDHISTYDSVPLLGRKSFSELCIHVGFSLPDGGFPQFPSEAVLRKFIISNWKSGKLSSDTAMKLIAGGSPSNLRKRKH